MVAKLTWSVEECLSFTEELSLSAYLMGGEEGEQLFEAVGRLFDLIERAIACEVEHISTEAVTTAVTGVDLQRGVSYGRE